MDLCMPCVERGRRCFQSRTCHPDTLPPGHVRGRGTGRVAGGPVRCNLGGRPREIRISLAPGCMGDFRFSVRATNSPAREWTFMSVAAWSYVRIGRPCPGHATKTPPPRLNGLLPLLLHVVAPVLIGEHPLALGIPPPMHVPQVKTPTCRKSRCRESSLPARIRHPSSCRPCGRLGRGIAFGSIAHWAIAAGSSLVPERPLLKAA